MIYSMTGFGRGESTEGLFRFIVEIKTVNHRYLDILIRMPKKLNSFEEQIKGLIKSRVSRGRVEVYITAEESVADDLLISPNYTVLDQYFQALTQVKERYNLTENIGLSLLARYPDAMKTESKEADEEALWAALSGATENALDALVAMRNREGETLRNDVLERIEMIRNAGKQIGSFSPQIIEGYRSRMTERIKEMLGDAVEIDENRILHEVAVFADKSNITEELVRLESHLDQAVRILNEPNPAGRKLDFLVQEMNREINTIGSKSPDIGIANLVIDVKSEIEKIREQIQNLE